MKSCIFMISETMSLTFEDESDDEEDVLTHESKTYKGVHINFPLTKSDIDTLIDSFRRKKVSFLIFVINMLYKCPN